VPEEENTTATPERLHRAGAPIVFIDAAARPARLRPAGLTSPLLQHPPSSAPTVSSVAAVPILSPTAAGVAEEPSVENPRHHPFPTGRRAVLFVQEPDAPLFSPATAVASPPPRRAAGSGCRRLAHGTATPRPWDARTRARACTPWARDLAAPQPSLACATALPCASAPATRPRRRVRVAAMPLRHFPERPSGVHTRTRASAPTRTHAHLLSHQIQPRRTGSRRDRHLGPSCQ
jgi:hypothetical protein